MMLFKTGTYDEDDDLLEKYNTFCKTIYCLKLLFVILYNSSNSVRILCINKYLSWLLFSLFVINT